MPTTDQRCTTPDCMNVAAFRTRTRDAWCDSCLDVILAKSGMRRAEPFPGATTDWWLMRCLSCGDTASYRLVHLLEHTDGRNICDACKWEKFSRTAGRGDPMSASELSALTTQNGYCSNVEIEGTVYRHDTVSVTCVSCGRRKSRLVRDLSYGCDCLKNSRRVRPTDPPSRKGQLLRESGLPAADWWDHDLNSPDAYAKSKTLGRTLAWWRCPVCDHSFSAMPKDLQPEPRCPACAQRRSDERDRMWQMPVASVTELRFAWQDAADASVVLIGDHTPRAWRCPNGHSPHVRPSLYWEHGCPSCRANSTRKEQKMVSDLQPELSQQWHPTRNGKLSPDKVVWNSRRSIWWLSECCGHEWEETPLARDKYKRLRCPACRSILGSLAWKDPGLAMEWSPTNPESVWHVRPGSRKAYDPLWVCAVDQAHTWTASLVSRSSGSECPDCRVHGKSKVELEHFAAAEELFGNARSGAILAADEFTSRKSWSADISFEHAGRTVVVEYDGAYYHQPEANVLRDHSKTRDLLAAGHRVVRLRENDLVFLDIDHPDLLQLKVLATAPRSAEVMVSISKWLGN
jgi:rubredoxin